jgi:hypothetical protein
MPKKKFTNGDKIFLNQAFEKMLRSQGFREGLYPDLFAQLIDGNAVTENLTFYVDAVNGDDSNDGLTASSAYRTIQACLDDNVTGKFLYGSVTINCAAGNYGGIRLDHAIQVAGSVTIVGTMQLATLTTGLNSTTISSWANTSQTTPDNPFQITCTGANWTTNNLRDKFVKITRQSNGSITYWTVVENTADTVKLNSWGLTPSVGDLVEIVEPASNFTNGYVSRIGKTQTTVQLLQSSLNPNTGTKVYI